jgi:hypothetical protein
VRRFTWIVAHGWSNGRAQTPIHQRISSPLQVALAEAIVPGRKMEGVRSRPIQVGCTRQLRRPPEREPNQFGEIRLVSPAEAMFLGPSFERDNIAEESSPSLS